MLSKRNGSYQTVNQSLVNTMPLIIYYYHYPTTYVNEDFALYFAPTNHEASKKLYFCIFA